MPRPLDITQRKDLEESLLLAQHCVDNAGEAIFAFAPDGRILYANQSAHELYGYDPEEMPSLTVFDLDPDLTAGTWSSLWGPAGTSISSLTANPRKKNGERFLAEVSISYVQYGERVQSFTFVRDVTARRQAEEARRISENRFRQMFQSISSGFVVYEAVNQGEDFVVAEFNAAAERITRIAKDEAIGRSVADLFPGVRALGLLEVVRRVWASGVAETLPASEYRDARLNVWVENFVYRLPSGEVCAVFDDVTEKWQALQGLQSAYDHLWHARIGTLQALGAITEFRDPYTAGHQRRVAKIAVAIGRRLGLSSHELEGLHAAAIVHDIGKIAVPIEILSSPAILNDGQLEMVHEHVTAGYEILRTIDFEWPVADIVRQHHERLDGSGYPRGLQGREILREALILGVADMFEAMISHRPYRAALGKDVALRELVAGSGVLYDAPAVAALMEIDFDAELQADEPHPMSPRPQLLSIAAPLD